MKSDTAEIHIPEIGVDLEQGTLGSKFTTIEGFLKDLKDNIENMPFLSGDSVQTSEQDNLKALVSRIDKCLNVEIPFTIIIDDILANSYIQNPYVPNEDPCTKVEEYERTKEQNDDLGINDMKVD